MGGRVKKKGQAGSAKNYITRNQAIRKLQINLREFRRLCIWKGIFPREPKSKKKVLGSATAATTFYYTKDIQYLLHEPLIQKFRDQKVLEKKISKALGRGDFSDAKRYERNAARPHLTGKPTYTLNHIIKERYPTFIDALRDLDDCLSMLFLFSNLQGSETIPAKMIARCERLTLEFQHYLIMSHSLRKSFLSIKGIYYQANIQGEDILWLAPYKFKQQVIGDIDFRIMATFVEFYMTLLGFVNYRLYTTLGLKYPPKFDQAKDDEAAELGAFTVESQRATAPTADSDADAAAIEAPKPAQEPNPEVQEKVNKLIEEMKVSEGQEEEQTNMDLDVVDDGNETLDKMEPAVPGGDILLQPSYSTTNPGKLFANCTIFLSRETPRGPIEFILRAFGCKRIGWDTVLGAGAFTHDEKDPRITHQVVDRPPIQATVNEEGDGEDNQTAMKLKTNQREAGRIYVQPQWVWDSINDEELRDVTSYVPGAQLPPHLSPFVKSAPGAYDPTIPLEEQEPEGEALESDEESLADDDEDEEEVGKVDDLAVKEIDDEDIDVADMLAVEDEDEDEEEEEEEDADEDNFGGFSDQEDEPSENEEEQDMRQRRHELEAEVKGKAVKAIDDPKAKAKAEARKQIAAKAKQEAEELQRQKGMMSKKKRRMYERMEHGHNKKNTEAEKLRAKRRKIEKGAAKGAQA